MIPSVSYSATSDDTDAMHSFSNDHSLDTSDVESSTSEIKDDEMSLSAVSITSEICCEEAIQESKSKLFFIRQCLLSYFRAPLWAQRIKKTGRFFDQGCRMYFRLYCKLKEDGGKN